MLEASAIAFALSVVAAPASAEVVQRTADSFTIRHSVALKMTAEDAPDALEHIDQWWSSAHTWSGDAKNLRLQLQPNACWCELMPGDDQIAHGQVVSVSDRQVVLEAPLGPLRGRATSARLVISWPAANRGRTLTWTMTVRGPGLGAVAAPVDGVMAEQFQRMVRFIEYGRET